MPFSLVLEYELDTVRVIKRGYLYIRILRGTIRQVENAEDAHTA